MTFKVIRTFRMPASDYENEVLARVGATMEIAPFAAGQCTEEDVLSYVKDAYAVITVFEPFTRRVIGQLTNCRLIANFGIGYQNIDIAAATDYGICVTNNPEYCLEEVSDHAMALLLNLARRIRILNEAVHGGKTTYGEIAQARGRVFRLQGQTLGLVAFGRIPIKLVPKARGFGLNIIAYDPYVSTTVVEKAGVELVSFDRLLEESDYISIHAALNPENEGMFGLPQFKKMKSTAYLINTARGGLIDNDALYTALSQGMIAGAALDVTEPEPINIDNRLLKLNNVIFTGHSAYFSETSTIEQRKGPVNEIARVLTGEWPRALVNPQVKDKFIERWRS
jgi:D-3-phosphoglycerate dehydrogenase